MCSINAAGQNSSLKAYTYSGRFNKSAFEAKSVLKYSPISHLDPRHPALQFAFEHKISPIFYLEHEAGWIKLLTNDEVAEVKSLDGFRIMEEIRYYLNSHPFVDPFFISAQLTWRQSTVKNTETLSYDDGAYFQTTSLESTDDLKALTMGFGFQTYSPNDPFTFEYGFNIGVRWFKVTNNVPDRAELIESDDFFNRFAIREAVEEFTPHFQIFFKVGFVVKR